MAQQDSIIKLKGRIGDLTFYKTADGYQVRRKTGVSGSRIANDPRFQRTRENGAEFARAGKAVKLFRRALAPVIRKGADRTLTNRLMKTMVRVVQADSVSDRGLRQVLPGNVGMLAGFELNVRAALETSIKQPYTAAIDTETGELAVNLPALAPEDDIAIPEGATHFEVEAAGATIAFDTGAFALNRQSSGILPVDAPAEAATLTCTLTPVEGQPLLLLLAILYHQEINGKFYSLSNGAYNAIAIIQVAV